VDCIPFLPTLFCLLIQAASPPAVVPQTISTPKSGTYSFEFKSYYWRKEDLKPELILKKQDFGVPFETKKRTKAEFVSAKIQRALSQ
jgi:hypothetical protein